MADLLLDPACQEGLATLSRCSSQRPVLCSPAKKARIVAAVGAAPAGRLPSAHMLSAQICSKVALPYTPPPDLVCACRIQLYQ